MAAIGRRKIDMGLMAAAGAVIGLGGCLAASARAPERINEYWAMAELIDDSGSAQITEVIEYDFGFGEKRGIFRDVPGLNASAPIEVSSPTAPDDVAINPRNITPLPRAGDTRIRVGDPNITISGRHRYQLSYPLETLVFPSTERANASRVSWNAHGDRWPVEAKDLEVHLLAPFEMLDPLCSAGAAGRVGGCNVRQVAPGHLVAEVDSVGARRGVTLSAELGAPVDPPALPVVPGFAVNESEGLGLGGTLGLTGGLALLAAAPTSFLVRRAGREKVWAGGATEAALGPEDDLADAPYRRVDAKELAEMAAIDFSPPPDMDPWQGGVIWAERFQDHHRVSWLIDRSHAGEIELVEEPKLRMNVGPAGVRDRFLQEMFAHSNSISLTSYNKTFATAWGKVELEMKEFANNSPLWDRGGDSRRMAAVGLGLIGLLFGAIMIFGGAVAATSASSIGLISLIIGALSAGAGATLLIRSWEMRVRTPRGSAIWIQIESFRRFLERSEAKHAEWAADHGILREYTAWAVALDEIDRWSNAIQGSPRAMQVDPYGYRMAYLAPRLGAATASTARAPSSSGGGGGGVGGGGGGGGGGSW